MKLLWKVVKVFVLVITTLLIVFSAGVYVYQDELIALFTKKASNMVDTDIYLDRVQVSFWSKFPYASIDLDNVVIIEAYPDSKDTLLKAESVYLTFDLYSLVDQNYTIKKCYVENARANFRIDKRGRDNYSILREETTTNDKKNKNLNFALEELVFKNINLKYNNQQKRQLYHTHIHKLTTSFNIKNELIATKIQGSFKIQNIFLESTSYVRNKNIKLNIAVNHNSERNKTVIQPSEILIEKAKFETSGVIKQMNDATDLSISLKGHKTNIQSLLSLLPHDIYQNFADFESRGMVYFNAKVKGKVSVKSSPHININFGFENTSFFHKETKQQIVNANLKGTYSNGSKNSKQTSFLHLKDISGKIHEAPFSGNFEMQNFDKPYLKGDLTGEFDVNALLRLSGVKNIKEANGKLTANFNLRGFLDDLKDENNLHNTDLSGAIKVDNINIDLPMLNYPLKNVNGEILINKSNVAISDFNAILGESDVQMQGYFHHFIRYILLENEILDIDGRVTAKKINVDELLNLVKESKSDSVVHNETASHFELPNFLALKLDCKIDTLQYAQYKDENIIKELKGKVLLRNQKARLDGLQLSIAKGSLGLSGVIDTQPTNIFTIDGKLMVDNIEIGRVFFLLNNFEQEVFTNKNIEGEVHGEVDTHIEFTKALDFNTKAFKAEIDMTIDNGKILDFEPMIDLEKFMKKKHLSRYLKNDDLSAIEFSQLKNHIQIQNDTIFIPYMKIISTANDFTVTGKHTFESYIDYDIEMPIVNYNRQERNEKLGIFLDKESNKFNVYLHIYGPLDNYEIEVRKQETWKSAKRAFIEGVKESVRVDGTTNTEVIRVNDTEEWIDEE